MPGNAVTITFERLDRERIERFRHSAGGGMSASALVRLVLKNWLNDVDKRAREFNSAMEVVARNNSAEIMDAGKIDKPLTQEAL